MVDFKGNRIYFNVIVTKNKTNFATKYSYLGLKNWRHVFREQNLSILMI